MNYLLTFNRLRSAQSKVVLKALAKNLDHPKFGTDTAAGIEAARNMINAQGRPTAPEIIVVITDGRSTNPRNTILQVSHAKLFNWCTFMRNQQDDG